MRSAALLTFLTFVATCSARVIQDRYVVELHDLQALSGGKRSFGSVSTCLSSRTDPTDNKPSLMSTSTATCGSVMFPSML